jgi:hypothetical protein
LHLPVTDRKRLRRLSVESGRDHARVIARALKALERDRKRQASAEGDAPSPFRVRCEIEGQVASEVLEQLQGLVNEVVRWLLAQGVSEMDIPIMLVALGAQCIREGERSERFQAQQQVRYEEESAGNME